MFVPVMIYILLSVKQAGVSSGVHLFIVENNNDYPTCLWCSGSLITASVDDVARLHNDLFSNYKRVIPPVYNQSHSVSVKLSMFLLMIHDLDMRNQVLTTSGWLNIQWQDEFLKWNKSEYGGVEDISVSQSTVWLPDLLIENTAQSFAELGNSAMLISIDHDGKIFWEPGIVAKTICEVNIGKYPFDYQLCEIKFLTWMHTNRTLEVHPGSTDVSLDACIPNGEWDIQTTAAESYFYPSTYRPGTKHTGVTFKLHLLRKRTFYVLNTIVPVVMLSLLNVLVFLLPASSGEKMALAVTVLLSFTVYLSIISEVMPKTSESISILAVYLTVLLSLSTMSVLSSGVVMNMIHQNPDRPIPNWVRCLLCCRLRALRREKHRKVESDKHMAPLRRYENGDAKRRHSDTDSKIYPENVSLMDSRNDKEGTIGREFTPIFDESDFDMDNYDPLQDITWLEVGGAVDNLLFWVFLIVTMTATSVVFLMFSF